MRPLLVAIRSLRGLVRFYAGPELDFDVELVLKKDEVPGSTLGGDGGPRLGWTSWLKTREFSQGDGEVRIPGR